MILIFSNRTALVRALTRGLAQGPEPWTVEYDAFTDLRQMRQVIRRIDEVRPRVVMLARSWDDPLGCQADPDAASLRNAESCIHVAAGALKHRARSVLLSTAEVFEQSGGPFSEADEPEPRSVWAESRRRGEVFLTRTDRRGLVLRTGPILEDGLEAERLRLKRAPIEEANDQWVSPVGGEDLGRVLGALLAAEATGVVHVAPREDPVTRAEFLRLAAEGLGFEAERVRAVPGRRLIRGGFERAPRPVLFADRLSRLGIPAPRPFRDALPLALAAAPVTNVSEPPEILESAPNATSAADPAANELPESATGAARDGSEAAAAAPEAETIRTEPQDPESIRGAPGELDVAGAARDHAEAAGATRHESEAIGSHEENSDAIRAAPSASEGVPASRDRSGAAAAPQATETPLAVVPPPAEPRRAEQRLFALTASYRAAAIAFAAGEVHESEPGRERSYYLVSGKIVFELAETDRVLRAGMSQHVPEPVRARITALEASVLIEVGAP